MVWFLAEKKKTSRFDLECLMGWNAVRWFWVSAKAPWIQIHRISSAAIFMQSSKYCSIIKIAHFIVFGVRPVRVILANAKERTKWGGCFKTFPILPPKKCSFVECFNGMCVFSTCKRADGGIKDVWKASDLIGTTIFSSGHISCLYDRC